MAHVAANSPATSTQYNDHDDRIVALEGEVTQLVAGPGVAFSTNQIMGTFASGTTTAAGRLTVTNPVGRAGIIVVPTNFTSGANIYYSVGVLGVSATQIIFVVSQGASPANGIAVNIWALIVG